MGLKQRLSSPTTALRYADFRLLWGAQILSELGDWAARLALTVLVFDRTRSSVLATAVVAVGLLPWLGLGQALSTLSDRFPRRTVMVVCDALRGGVFLSMLFIDQVWLILFLAFVAAAATPPFESARAAVIPEVVPEESYGRALTVSNVTYQVGLVVGYMAGGGLVALVGARWSLVVNAATFAASAALLTRMRGGRLRHGAHGISKSLGRALAVLRGDPFLLRAAAIATIGASCAMVGEALVTPYVREHLDGSDATIGLLAAMVPIGTVIASLAAPKQGDHARLLRASAALVLVGSAGAFVAFAVEHGLIVSAAGYVLLGVCFAMVVPAYNVVGTRLPADVRASAFGILQGLLLGGQALFALLGGLLANVIGPAAATALALVPAVGYGAYALVVPPGGRGFGGGADAVSTTKEAGA